MTTLTAPMKLNLLLVVGDVRPDGYHTVTTVLAALDEGDEISVEPARVLSLTCEPDVGIPPEENLAWRAAVAMGEAFGQDPAFVIRIGKRIPTGAGLGGGSSDAAAVIASIAAAWHVERSDPRLETVARTLGADVPFFLRGGCGVYAGRGDTLRRSLPVPVGHYVVVFAGEPVPTARAYAAFDAFERQPRPSASQVTGAICQRDIAALGAGLFNNMSASVVALVPAVGDALAFMRDRGGCAGAGMSGSGSAVFGVFAEAADADAAAAAAEDLGWWSLVARPRVGGAIDETMGAQRDTDQSRRRHLGRRRR
jgi:4-diphosphocytidyl-2-C-methyl-D-erythritol kinase